MTTIVYDNSIPNIEYFKNKLKETVDHKERIKLQRIIDSLEDAVVIYKLTLPPRE